MAGITLDQAQAKLDLWLTAEEAIAAGQAYRIDSGTGSSRQLTRADLAEVGKRVAYWRQQVALLSRAAQGKSRTRYFVN